MEGLGQPRGPLEVQDQAAPQDGKEHLETVPGGFSAGVLVCIHFLAGLSVRPSELLSGSSPGEGFPNRSKLNLVFWGGASDWLLASLHPTPGSWGGRGNEHEEAGKGRAFWRKCGGDGGDGGLQGSLLGTR